MLDDFISRPIEKGSAEMKARWAVLRDWSGFVMSRNGRVLNTITHIKKNDWDSMPKGIKNLFKITTVTSELELILMLRSMKILPLSLISNMLNLMQGFGMLYTSKRTPGNSGL